jgi:CHASE2 domain-containing sensor protein
LSHHSSISPARLFGECVLAVVTGCVLAFLLHWLFGEEFATRQQARVYAPIAGVHYGDGKRDDIRVVLIDDAALQSAGQVWPARYSYSARLLSAVAQYKPKAIFVDIYYGAARDDASLPALTRALCAIREQGVALYMATARDGAGEYRLRPEIDALAGKCYEKVAIQYAPDDIDRVAWSYPLEVHGGGHAAPLKSAALALYESGGSHLSVDHHPLSVTWGSRAATNGVGWLRERATGEHSQDGGQADKSYCRASHGYKELIPPGIRNAMYHDIDQPLCVFHETLRAGEFAHTTVEADARLKRDIEGKTILIGLANTDSADFVLSPLHGRIPGIYLHAMALDNLQVAGNAYARNVHLGLGRDYAVMLLFLLVSMMLITLVPKLVLPWVARRLHWKAVDDPVEYLAKRLRLRRRAGFQFGIAISFVLIAVLRLCMVLAIGCAMVWIGQRFFGLGFLSVISVIFITLMAEWFEVNEKLSHYLLPRHSARLRQRRRTSQGASHADPQETV